MSDERDKKDIVPFSSGLEFVSKIKPVSFVWDTRDGIKKDIPDNGFIAQDLLQVQKDIGITIPGLVEDTNPDKLLASYGKLLPIMVKAIQELKVEVDSLKQQLSNQ